MSCPPQLDTPPTNPTRTPATPPYRVGPSGIHGMGLFATAFIPADTEIGPLEGRHTAEDGPHVLWIDETRGFRVTNDLRFINHADEPNAVYYDDLTVAALTDIYPGQEITHHYDGDEAEDADELPDFEGVEEEEDFSSAADEPAQSLAAAVSDAPGPMA